MGWFFVKVASFSGPFFLPQRFCPSPSWRQPRNQPAHAWCPLKTTPTGEGWGFRFSMKGDGQKTHSRAEKKRP